MDHPAATVVRPTLSEAIAQLLFYGGARLDIVPAVASVSLVEVIEHKGERSAVLHVLLGGYKAVASYGVPAQATGLARKVTAPGEALARVGAAAYALTAAAPAEDDARHPVPADRPAASVLH